MNHIWYGMVQESIEPAREQLLHERDQLERDRQGLTTIQAENLARRCHVAELKSQTCLTADMDWRIEQTRRELYRLRKLLAERQEAVDALAGDLVDAEMRLTDALR